MNSLQKLCCKRITFLLILASIVTTTVKAQQPFLRNYSVSEGLPSFEIYSLFQDSKGLLWFATDAGVSCYDGYSFRNFTSRDSLADNTIFGFYEDWKGRIWFRSYNGLLSYYDGRRIISPPVNAELRKLHYGKLFLSMYIDRYDTIWLGRREEKSLVRILPGFSEIDKHSPLAPDGNFVREMEPGKFMIGSNDASIISTGLLFYPLHSASPLVLKETRCDVSHISCTNLSNGETIIVFQGGHYVVKDKIAQKINDPLQIIRVVPSKGNNYWACLAGQKGVQLIEHTSAGDRVIKTLLSGYSVTDCVEDREGGIWFTTLEKGVFYMPYPEVEEIHFNLLADGEKITSMSTLPNGSLIASTSYGGLFAPDSISWNPPIGAADKPGYISSLLNNGNIFGIGSNFNCILFDDRMQKYIVVHDSSGRVPLLAISGFDNERLCGVSIRSAYLIDIRSGMTSTMCKLLPDRMRCICKGRGDTLWLGGLNGLWMLAPGKTPVNMSVLDPMLGQRIDFLYYDPVKDRLWMSSKGVGLLLKEGQRVSDFSHLRPQIAPTCRALNADEEGNLWVATNAGAFCVSELPGGKFVSREFSIRNGLSSNDIVGIKHIGDTLWIAASDRIIRFRLNDYPRNLIPPPLLMRSIIVGGNEIDPTSSENNFQFNSEDNTIAFSFTGISYKSFGQVHYRFRLIGADSAWKETQSNEAVFYELPPGEYKFCLYALNNDGITQTKPLEFSFIILPPFWQRWWFIVSAIVLLLLAVTFFIRFRIKRVRRKEIFNRRLIEMEMTALRAQMSPHFIFNAINSIHNFVLTGDKKSSSAYLAKFAKLIRNVLENSGQKQIPLIKEIETLELYIEIERMRFSDDFNFKIETDPSLNLSSLMVVPLLLQPYVENAIWHGLLHKKSLGHLLISIKDAGTMLRCVIDDDGIGREQAALFKHQRNAGNTSMGGEISLRRLNLLNNLYGTKFSLNYKDKKNPDGTSAGTCVELLIPKVNKTEQL